MTEKETATGLAEPSTDLRSTSSRNMSNRAPKGDGTQTTAGPPKGLIREYFESAVITIVMALFGITFIVQAVKVPTSSMQNTILVGDHLLVNKFIFAPGPYLPFLPQREIRRGDIIVFKYPGNKEDPERDRDPNNTPFTTNYVKRVVGLPDEEIEVRGTTVYINGAPLKEHIVPVVNESEKAPLQPVADAEQEGQSGDGSHTVYYQHMFDRSLADFRFAVNKPTRIPSNHYFVMGDNRDNSSDSRAWGFVPRELIVGRALFVYWSYDESAPSTGFFITDFITNTRWGRTGTMIK
jgi:signal peptidase I